MRHPDLSLDDKYTKRDGSIFLTGIQALVRLALVQRWRDIAAGIDSAGFISGYRGSPLGGYDQQLQKAAEHLAAQNIRFQPGVNEDLAATAVWGSQQTNLFPGARVEGVFGLWYGKAPGLDRSGDAIRHANFAGTSPKGGVLAVVGDDPAAKSSSLPSQSEYSFMDLEIPVLNPANVREVLEFGLYGWAMSRYAGLWVGMIALADIMDSAATVSADQLSMRIHTPEPCAEFGDFAGGRSIRTGDEPQAKEARLRHFRLPAAQRFARLNRLDRITLNSSKAKLGIVATGRAYHDLRQAMQSLGISDADARALGLRIYKVGMSWPLEPEGLHEFATGLERILVIDHKRGVLESQIKAQLYSLPAASRPEILGKQDRDGAPLLDNVAMLGQTEIATALLRQLPESEIRARAERAHADIQTHRDFVATHLSSTQRTPFFCSGCPHNRSTKVPEGSRALAGVGCHYMAQIMDRDTDMVSQMGGEGASWIGQAPFTDERHIFVNLGDGTYFHSGLLAIRAAVAANVPITYKILYNDAVAMTGGQPIDGSLSVPQLIAQLRAEGVRKISLVSDAPEKHTAASDIPADIEIAHRNRFPAIQKKLRDYAGVSVIIYDQTCASEKRRRRKRGKMDEPPRRLFINEAVCEGCGDCSVQSSCASIEPVETEFGRKRRINQSSCNKDYSCLEGSCPSFVSVMNGDLAGADMAAEPPEIGAAIAALPAPAAQPVRDTCNILITGIGGAGVTTVGALLATAAHIDGLAAATLDMTGLAQKGGAVLSHVRIGAADMPINGPQVPEGQADLLLAGDMVVSAGEKTLTHVDRRRTQTVLNTHLSPTAAFIENTRTKYDAAEMTRTIAGNTARLHALEATQIAERWLGDGVYANMILLGMAYQRGLLPMLTRDAIAQAIGLNGTAVAQNLRAFDYGRLAAEQPDILYRADNVHPFPLSLDGLIARRRKHLGDYQDTAYADRYSRLVARVRAAESRIRPGHTALAEAVARNYAKLLAYKDEFEVARLYTDGRFADSLARQFKGKPKIKLHISPPLVARRDPDTGRPRKIAVGSWILPAFKLLARMKGLRQSPLNPFGWSADRRLEKALIAEYEDAIERILGRLTAENHETAVAIANLPDDIRGFGPVKQAAANATRHRAMQLLSQFTANRDLKEAM
jgi:indolepyruvate ferredoxin oxidoreductase